MNRFLSRLFFVAAMSASGLAFAQSAAQPASLPPDAVTVVIQITLAPGVKPEAAAGSMNDMRAMIKKQPGFLAEEFVQNVNSANSPSYVHVIRWAAFKYWEGVYTSPEFAKLNAAGGKQYSVSASAFKAVK